MSIQEIISNNPDGYSIPAGSIGRTLVADSLSAISDSTYGSLQPALRFINRQAQLPMWQLGTTNSIAGTGVTSAGQDLILANYNDAAQPHVVPYPLQVSRLTGAVTCAGLTIASGNMTGALLPSSGTGVLVSAGSTAQIPANCTATSVVVITRTSYAGTPGHIGVNVTNGSFHVDTTGAETSAFSWFVVNRG